MDSLLKAINFATTKHSDQKRKDNKTPYISHVLGVALILSQVTNDRDIIIAGILHDTLEDTDTSDNEIMEQFGPKVLKIVQELTEEDKKPDWKTRKEQALRKLPEISREAALVKAADILHNLHSDDASVQKLGAEFYKIFEAGRKDKIEYEGKRLELFKKHHQDVGLLNYMEKYLAKIETRSLQTA